MKILSASFVLLASLQGSAFADIETNYVGTFVENHTISVIGYTEANCGEEKGHWNGDTCEFSAANTIKIEKDTAGNSKAYKASIEVVTTNFDSCRYNGNFTVITGNRLVSVTWPNGESQPSCKVLVRFLPPTRSDLVEVTHMGDGCSYYCGMRAGLNIASASRTAN